MTNFELLVLEMRKVQKEYFRTKAAGVLQKCRELQKKVDDYLGICDQPELFGGNNKK
jgi:hypothetical protein